MATTISMSTDLDVIAKYEGLVKSSLGSESVYIRLKETINKLAEEGGLSDAERAKVITETLSQIGSSISSSSMSTALQWASAEKDLFLKKFELELSADILKEDALLKKSQIKQSEFDVVAKKAEVIRMYGNPTVDVNGNVTLSETGKIVADIALTNQQKNNAVVQESLYNSQINESYAAIHKAIAETYVQHGRFTYTLGSNGVSAVTEGTPTTHTPLTAIQALIAKEQAKGYAYNAWANALTSSAGTLGTLIASNLIVPGSGTPGGDFLDNVNALLGKMGTIEPGSLS